MGGMGGTEGGTDGGTVGTAVAHGDAERATDATRWQRSEGRSTVAVPHRGLFNRNTSHAGWQPGPWHRQAGRLLAVDVRAWRAHEFVATPVEFVDGAGDGARACHERGHFVQWVGGNLWCVHPYPSLNNFFFLIHKPGQPVAGGVEGVEAGRRKRGVPGERGRVKFVDGPRIHAAKQGEWGDGWVSGAIASGAGGTEAWKPAAGVGINS